MRLQSLLLMLWSELFQILWQQQHSLQVMVLFVPQEKSHSVLTNTLHFFQFNIIITNDEKE